MFLAGALLHEDFRYWPSASRNPLIRTLHAVVFTFVDRSDAGGKRMALANLAGAEAGGLVGTLYLPPGFNNFSHAETRAVTALAGITGQSLLWEFAPERQKLKRKLHLPSSSSQRPRWWTRRD